MFSTASCIILLSVMLLLLVLLFILAGLVYIILPRTFQRFLEFYCLWSILKLSFLILCSRKLYITFFQLFTKCLLDKDKMILLHEVTSSWVRIFFGDPFLFLYLIVSLITDGLLIWELSFHSEKWWCSTSSFLLWSSSIFFCHCQIPVLIPFADIFLYSISGDSGSTSIFKFFLPSISLWQMLLKAFYISYYSDVKI